MERKCLFPLLLVLVLVLVLGSGLRAQNCEGCSGSNHSNLGGVTACVSVVLTTQVIRSGECQPNCLTKKTCVFSWTANVTIGGVCGLRTVYQTGVPGTETPATATADYFEGFVQSGTVDTACNTFHLMEFYELTWNGSELVQGQQVGVLHFVCAACRN